MGLIRKSLMVSTGGMVRGSSKKQRVAKNSLKEQRAQTRLMREQAAVPAAPQPIAVPAGWYVDPDGAPALRWWDGSQWTDATAPKPR